MIQLDIPGRGTVNLEHLVLDVNGTIAKDGRLLDRIAKPLTALKDRLEVHMVTADTYGRQQNIDLMLGTTSLRLDRERPEAEQKAEFVRSLGAERVVAIGNGVNDVEMLRAAAIGIAVQGGEGLAVAALIAADVVVDSALEAFNLLEYPLRLVATLRG